MIKTKGKLRRFALFYLGVVMIAASIVSGLITYYYPVSVEIGREEIILPVEEDGFVIEIPPNQTSNQTFAVYLRREVRIDRRTTFPLRDYALLTYLLSGVGLGLIVTHNLRQSEQERA